jgi:hypothetical protein
MRDSEQFNLFGPRKESRKALLATLLYRIVVLAIGSFLAWNESDQMHMVGTQTTLLTGVPDEKPNAINGEDTRRLECPVLRPHQS